MLMSVPERASVQVWENKFLIDNLLVRIHLIIVMIRWTGLAPWEFEIPFPGSLTSAFSGLGAPDDDAHQRGAPHEHARVNPKPKTFRPETSSPKPQTRNPKSETPNPKPEARNPIPETRNSIPGPRNSRPDAPNLKPNTRCLKPETRNPKPKTRNPKPEKRDPKHETRSPKPDTRNPKPDTRDPRPESRNPKPETLKTKPSTRFGSGWDRSLKEEGRYSLLYFLQVPESEARKKKSESKRAKERPHLRRRAKSNCHPPAVGFPKVDLYQESVSVFQKWPVRETHMRNNLCMLRGNHARVTN